MHTCSSSALLISCLTLNTKFLMKSSAGSEHFITPAARERQPIRRAVIAAGLSLYNRMNWCRKLNEDKCLFYIQEFKGQRFRTRCSLSRRCLFAVILSTTRTHARQHANTPTRLCATSEIYHHNDSQVKNTAYGVCVMCVCVRVLCVCMLVCVCVFILR